MSNFLSSFVTAWEEEPTASPEPDDSRAPNVNVLLRKARGRLQGTISAEELGRELEALLLACERTQVTLEGLELGPWRAASLEQLELFARVLNEFEAWSTAPDQASLDQLRERAVGCGERLVELQAGLAVAGQQSEEPKLGPVDLEEHPVDVPPEVSRLYRLTWELVDDPTRPGDWQQCLSGLQASFQAALAQARVAAVRRSGDADLGGVLVGLEAVVQGLQRLSGYPLEKDTTLLADGWVEMLEGFRHLQAATCSLQSRLQGD